PVTTMPSTEDARVAMPSSAEPRGAGRAYVIAIIAVAGIVTHPCLRWGSDLAEAPLRLPLYAVLAGGGVPLVLSLIRKAVLGQFGSDLLAGISIVSAVVLGEYLAGALVVLMLSGGEALESYAVAAPRMCCTRWPIACPALRIDTPS